MKLRKKLSPYQLIVNLSIKKSLAAKEVSGTNKSEFYNQNLKMMKTIMRTLCLVAVLMYSVANTYAQVRQTAAVLGIDSRGTLLDSESMSYLVRLEIEKSKIYSVMDRYDIEDAVPSTGIDINNCYSKRCLVEVGTILGVSKMITGSIDKYGDKIVITLRMINVKTNAVEGTDATEYINMPTEIHRMVEISVRNLFGLENDPDIVNILIDYNLPIISPATLLKLNGPRMGVAYISEEAGVRMQAPRSEGGYNMYPITTQFGYQWERQYLSAGEFQALFECIAMVGGLESSQFIPSLALLNGFRGNGTGLEFAFGPVFKIVRTTDGYYEDKLADGSQGDGKWHKNDDWKSDTSHWIGGDYYNIVDNPNEVLRLPDHRGSTKLSADLVLAVGRTFKSGYLNIPINFYVIPKKQATIYGLSVGFNISQRRKI